MQKEQLHPQDLRLRASSMISSSIMAPAMSQSHHGVWAGGGVIGVVVVDLLVELVDAVEVGLVELVVAVELVELVAVVTVVVGGVMSVGEIVTGRSNVACPGLEPGG